MCLLRMGEAEAIPEETVRPMTTDNRSAICEVCGSALVSNYRQVREFSLFRCDKCGLVFVHPQPSDSQLTSYYDEQYYNRPPRLGWLSAWLHQRTHISRAKRIATALPAGRILDVGCGPGHMLAALQDLGWEVEGLEVSEQAASVARERYGLPMHVGSMADLVGTSYGFDVITMWDVLEHVRDPNRVVEGVYSLLNGNGMLIIRVPNIGSLEARLFNKHWTGLDVPRHLYHFSERSLSQLLSRRGFRIAHKRRLAAMETTRRMLRNMLVTGRAGHLFPGWLVIGAAIVVAPAALLFGCADAVLSGGGEIEAWCKKVKHS